MFTSINAIDGRKPAPLRAVPLYLERQQFQVGMSFQFNCRHLATVIRPKGCMLPVHR